MPVDSLSCFPLSFVAGDTLRIALDNTDYPSSDWTLQAVFRDSAGVVTSFPATPNDDDDGFTLVIAAADTDDLAPGLYTVTFVYTETATSERFSDPEVRTLSVLPNPAEDAEKSPARLTLEAMEAALQTLAAGSNATVNFNGQSFTRKNLKELQDAIDRQRSVVRAEESALGIYGSTRRYSGIGVRFA